MLKNIMKKKLQKIFDVLDQNQLSGEARIQIFLDLLKQNDLDLRQGNGLKSSSLSFRRKDDRRFCETGDNFKKNIVEDGNLEVVDCLNDLLCALLHILSDLFTPESLQKYEYLFDIDGVQNLEQLRDLESKWKNILESKAHIALQKRVVDIIARLSFLSRMYDDKPSEDFVEMLLNTPQSITDPEILKRLENICDIGEAVLKSDEKLDTQDMHRIVNDLQNTLQENTDQIHKLKEIKNQIIERSNAIAESDSDHKITEIVNRFYDKVLFLNNSLQNKEKSIQNLSFQISRLTRILKDTEEKTRRDPLTNLYNHGYLNMKLSEFEEEFAQKAKNYSVLFFDIDGFKSINDTCGHMLGDEILILFSNILRKNSRYTDIVGRYGGDEFMIIMPNTSLSDAKDVALRICMTMETEGKNYKNRDMNITTSVGVSDRKRNISLEAMIMDADTLLYKAKRDGRNQVKW